MDSGVRVDHPDLVSNVLKGWNLVPPGQVRCGMGAGERGSGLLHCIQLEALVPAAHPWLLLTHWRPSLLPAGGWHAAASCRHPRLLQL